MAFEGSIKEFPSPIYGASFKQIYQTEYEQLFSACFRPLYTGLVSNLSKKKKSKTSIKCFRPLYTGLVSNWFRIYNLYYFFHIQFSSPIYGASFKRFMEKAKNIYLLNEEFPSPIYGASFKLRKKDIPNYLDYTVSVPYIRG